MKKIIITSLFALSLFNAHYSSAVLETLYFKIRVLNYFMNDIPELSVDIDLEPDVTTTSDIYLAVFKKIQEIVPDEIESIEDITLFLIGRQVPNSNDDLAINYGFGIERFYVTVKGKSYKIQKRTSELRSAWMQAIASAALKNYFDDEFYGGGASARAGAGSGT